MYILKQQETPFDDSESRWMFDPIGKSVLISQRTREAVEPELGTLLAVVHDQERLRGGLDSLQIFQSSEPDDDELLMIEEPEAILMVMATDYGDRVIRFIEDVE